MEGVNLIKSVVRSFNAFHQARFTKGISYHTAFFHILQDTCRGIAIQSDHIKCNEVML